MTPQRPCAAAGTAFLLFLISGCGADGTGPGGSDVVMDRVSIRIGQIDVIHDCDPASDNPGDFRGFVEIYHDMNPTPGNEDFELIAASPKTMILLNSGESADGGHIRAEALVPRLPARPVMVRGVFQELDHGEVDAGGTQFEVMGWDEHSNCWQIDRFCMANGNSADNFTRSWTVHVYTRDDVWNPFNSDDEGCRFFVTFVANIGE
jgi:hypothetical protein